MREFHHDQLAGRVVFGNGAFDRVPAELEQLRADRTLLIASGGAKQWADSLAEMLGGRVVARVDHVDPHVPMEAVTEARRQAGAFGAGSVVTIGGGSTTGLGKAIALVAPMPFLAVPTTYAGSEMTSIYGITEAGLKRTGRDPRVKPHTVVYDPELTLSIPPRVSAGSGMNAMAHCVEALYAEDRNPVTSLLAVEGIGAIERGLQAVAAAPRGLEGRTELLYGAYLAASAQASVAMAIHHKICHILGGSFGLAHGDANAVILPHAMAANAVAEPGVDRTVARTLGSPHAAAGLFDLVASIGGPLSLAELGMRSEDLDRVVALVMDHTTSNPRPVEPGWVRHLLEDAYAGRRP